MSYLNLKVFERFKYKKKLYIVLEKVNFPTHLDSNLKTLLGLTHVTLAFKYYFQKMNEISKDLIVCNQYKTNLFFLSIRRKYYISSIST